MVGQLIPREDLAMVCEEEFSLVFKSCYPVSNLIFQEETTNDRIGLHQEYGLEVAERWRNDWGREPERFQIEIDQVKQLLYYLLLDILCPDTATSEDLMEKASRSGTERLFLVLYKPRAAGPYIRVEEYREGPPKKRHSVLRVTLVAGVEFLSPV